MIKILIIIYIFYIITNVKSLKIDKTFGKPTIEYQIVTKHRYHPNAKNGKLLFGGNDKDLFNDEEMENIESFIETGTDVPHINPVNPVKEITRINDRLISVHAHTDHNKNSAKINKKYKNKIINLSEYKDLDMEKIHLTCIYHFDLLKIDVTDTERACKTYILAYPIAWKDKINFKDGFMLMGLLEHNGEQVQLHHEIIDEDAGTHQTEYYHHHRIEIDARRSTEVWDKISLFYKHIETAPFRGFIEENGIIRHRSSDYLNSFEQTEQHDKAEMAFLETGTTSGSPWTFMYTSTLGTIIDPDMTWNHKIVHSGDTVYDEIEVVQDDKESYTRERKTEISTKREIFETKGSLAIGQRFGGRMWEGREWSPGKLQSVRGTHKKWGLDEKKMQNNNKEIGADSDVVVLKVWFWIGMWPFPVKLSVGVIWKVQFRASGSFTWRTEVVTTQKITTVNERGSITKTEHKPEVTHIVDGKRQPVEWKLELLGQISPSATLSAFPFYVLSVRAQYNIGCLATVGSYQDYTRWDMLVTGGLQFVGTIWIPAYGRVKIFDMPIESLSFKKYKPGFPSLSCSDCDKREMEKAQQALQVEVGSLAKEKVRAFPDKLTGYEIDASKCISFDRSNKHRYRALYNIGLALGWAIPTKEYEFDQLDLALKTWDTAFLKREGGFVTTKRVDCALLFSIVSRLPGLDKGTSYGEATKALQILLRAVHNQELVKPEEIPPPIVVHDHYYGVDAIFGKLTEKALVATIGKKEIYGAKDWLQLFQEPLSKLNIHKINYWDTIMWTE